MGRLGSAGRQKGDTPSLPVLMVAACSDATVGCPEGSGGVGRPLHNLAVAPGSKMNEVVNLTLLHSRRTLDIQCISLNIRLRVRRFLLE